MSDKQSLLACWGGHGRHSKPGRGTVGGAKRSPGEGGGAGHGLSCRRGTGAGQCFLGSNTREPQVTKMEGYIAVQRVGRDHNSGHS